MSDRRARSAFLMLVLQDIRTSGRAGISLDVLATRSQTGVNRVAGAATALKRAGLVDYALESHGGSTRSIWRSKPRRQDEDTLIGDAIDIFDHKPAEPNPRSLPRVDCEGSHVYVPALIRGDRPGTRRTGFAHCPICGTWQAFSWITLKMRQHRQPPFRAGPCTHTPTCRPWPAGAKVGAADG